MYVFILYMVLIVGLGIVVFFCDVLYVNIGVGGKFLWNFCFYKNIKFRIIYIVFLIVFNQILNYILLYLQLYDLYYLVF